MATMRTTRALLLLLVISRALLCQTSNIVVGGGYVPPVPIEVAPGEVVTIFVQGVGAGLAEPVLASSLPLPTTLAGISVSLQEAVSMIPVPLFAVFPVKTCTSTQLTGCGSFTGITLQIPFEMGAGPAAIGAPKEQLIVTENGANGAAVELLQQVDKIHVLREGDTITRSPAQQPPSAASAIVTHADSSRVTATTPAKPGETLVLWAVGLGRTTPAVASGQATPASAPSAPVVLAFNYAPNAEPSRPTTIAECSVLSIFGCPPISAGDLPLFSGLVPGFVGLYQVNFVVPTAPAGLGPCSMRPLLVFSNLTVSIGRDESFDGAGICVAVSP